MPNNSPSLNNELIKNFAQFIAKVSDHLTCFDYIDEAHMLSSDFAILKLFKCSNQTLYYASKYRYDTINWETEKSQLVQEAILLTSDGLHYTYQVDNEIETQNLFLWAEIVSLRIEGIAIQFMYKGIRKEIDFSVFVGGKNQQYRKQWLALLKTLAGKDKENRSQTYQSKGEQKMSNQSATANSFQSVRHNVESKYQELISKLVQTKSKLAEFKAKNTKLTNLQMDFVDSFESEIEYVSKVMEQTINGMVWENLVIAFFGETNAGKSTTIETLRILFDPQKQQSTEDGLIVGDGQSDFTKTYDEYQLNIFGKPFTLIDVPGIEGKEEDFKDDIKRALQQAHIVFYVQGHNKKPDSATAEKIKKYLNDWVNVYSIYNVRGGVSNYDENEERDNLFTSDVDKTYTLIEDTFKDILGDVYKGNIAIQALLAMCAKAHFASKRDDLIKTQKKLVSYFGTAEDVFKFSNFQEIVNLIKTKTNHFDEELIIANKQKLVALCSYIIKEIEELESCKTADMQKLSNNLKQYRDAIKQVVQTTKQNLKVNTASANNRLFSSLQNNMCAAVDKTDLDNLEQQLTYQAAAFRNEYNDTMQQLVSNEFRKMNQSLKDKQKQYLDCFKQIPDIEIDPISIRGVELGNIISELEFNFGDFVKNALGLGAAVGLGALGGPIGIGIGVGLWGIKKIFVDGGESAEKKHKQNAKNELRQQLNTNKQIALAQLNREMEICSHEIDYKIGELAHLINKDLERIQSIKTTLTQVSKQIREYSNNIQNM